MSIYIIQKKEKYLPRQYVRPSHHAYDRTNFVYSGPSDQKNRLGQQHGVGPYALSHRILQFGTKGTSNLWNTPSFELYLPLRAHTITIKMLAIMPKESKNNK